MARLLLWLTIAALTALASSGRAGAGPLLWQTSSEGDDIYVFDLESRQLVRRLVVGPEPHGIAAPADARVVYVTLEANDRLQGELLWIDPRAYRIEHRMDICREPHAIATTPDGRWIYVPCRDEPGTRSSARSPSPPPCVRRRSRTTDCSSSTSTG